MEKTIRASSLPALSFKPPSFSLKKNEINRTHTASHRNLPLPQFKQPKLYARRYIPPEMQQRVTKYNGQSKPSELRPHRTTQNTPEYRKRKSKNVQLDKQTIKALSLKTEKAWIACYENENADTKIPAALTHKMALRAYITQNSLQKAWKVYNKMEDLSIAIDSKDYGYILNACARVTFPVKYLIVYNTHHQNRAQICQKVAESLLRSRPR